MALDTRFPTTANKGFSMHGLGIFAEEIAYAATIAYTPGDYFKQLVKFGQLTGAVTINATVTNLKEGDELRFYFETDGTQRIVTFGTNFVSSGTLTIAANKKAVVNAMFVNGAIHIMSREVEA